jgi:hypothetical protein
LSPFSGAEASQAEYKVVKLSQILSDSHD